MKATKMRNRQIYRASLRTRSNQLGSPLSKDLQKKYGKRSIRVVKGDTVSVVRGEYQDVDGKVSKVSTQANSVAIEGIKKEKGQGDKFDVLIHTSNVVVTSLNTDDSWRMSRLENKSPVKSKPTSEAKQDPDSADTDESTDTADETDEVRKVEQDMPDVDKKQDMSDTDEVGKVEQDMPDEITKVEQDISDTDETNEITKVEQDMPDVDKEQDMPDVDKKQDMPDVDKEQDMSDTDETNEITKVEQDMPDVDKKQDAEGETK